MPRQTECRPEVIEMICEDLRQGLTIRAASIRAGITEQTYHRWNNREEEPYRTFREAVARAIADSEQALLASVRRAASGSEGVPYDWRAAAWLLERRFHETWGPKPEKAVVIESGPRLTVQIDKLSQEQLATLVGAEVPLIEAISEDGGEDGE